MDNQLTRFEAKALEKRQELLNALAADEDLDDVERGKHMADFEEKVQTKRSEILKVVALHDDLIACAAKHGVALEMWVQSAGIHRTISFSNEVAGHGPLNPIIRLGFASFIAKSVDE